MTPHQSFICEGRRVGGILCRLGKLGVTCMKRTPLMRACACACMHTLAYAASRPASESATWQLTPGSGTGISTCPAQVPPTGPVENERIDSWLCDNSLTRCLNPASLRCWSDGRPHSLGADKRYVACNPATLQPPPPPPPPLPHTHTQRPSSLSVIHEAASPRSFKEICFRGFGGPGYIRCRPAHQLFCQLRTERMKGIAH
jgi:hypothetical protein